MHVIELVVYLIAKPVRASTYFDCFNLICPNLYPGKLQINDIPEVSLYHILL